MFGVTETEAVTTRPMSDQGGEVSAALELHRILPGITSKERVAASQTMERQAKEREWVGNQSERNEPDGDADWIIWTLVTAAVLLFCGGFAAGYAFSA